MKIKHLLPPLFFSLFILGCVKEEPFVEFDRYPNTPKGNFQAFWDGMSRKYSFWGYDPTNWDEVYDKYVNKVTDQTTDLELAEIFDEMIDGLIDGHYEIQVTIDTVVALYSPGFVNDKISNYHFLLDDEYFETKIFNRLSPGTRKKFQGFVYGVLDNKYQYIRIPSFSIFKGLASNPQFFLEMLEFMAKPAPQYKGVILDLRQNGGGIADEVPLIVGNFTDKELLVGESRYKYGSNRNEFSPWVQQKIYPNPKGYNPLPVVVLCNSLSISAAERTTMALSVLPQVTVVGETTFGAQSAVLFGREGEDSVYAGSFELPNGWTVKMAAEVYRFVDGKLYEGVGFTPDVVVPFDVNLFKSSGRDNQLERALQILPK
ncbi:MAG: S41 family peptidase [Saprospiraceae bacterium]|nr:S41 family peptidase [Saprospiraceae bacterium]MDW8484531.1 S41 family peptidase [Saprospiraceae bacterium]